MPGPPWQAEDRDTRLRRPGTNPCDRKCDQARVRIVAVLGHDEGPAVRGGGAVLSRVDAALERQLAGSRVRRDRDRIRAAGKVEIAEGEREEGNQNETDDPAAPEALRTGSLAVAGEGLVMQQDGLHGGSLSRVLPRMELPPTAPPPRWIGQASGGGARPPLDGASRRTSVAAVQLSSCRAPCRRGRRGCAGDRRRSVADRAS